MTLPTIKTAALIALVALVSACGSGTREIRGELPQVRFEGLEVTAQGVRLDIGLRNFNDRTLTLRELKVELTVEDELLLKAAGTPDIDISARGREVVSLRAPGHPDGRQLLTTRFGPQPVDSLSPAASNAAWTMELTLIDGQGRESLATANGFLHPVPGRPGQFR